MVMVRGHILTDRERNILEQYVESDIKLSGFSVLIHLLKKHKDRLVDDLILIGSALKKLENEKK